MKYMIHFKRRLTRIIRLSNNRVQGVIVEVLRAFRQDTRSELTKNTDLFGRTKSMSYIGMVSIITILLFDEKFFHGPSFLILQYFLGN